MAIPGLICCLILIAYLLMRDFRRRPSLSYAIWIPTILLLVIGSRPLSVWLSGGGASAGFNMANEAERSPADQIFYFSILATSLVVVLVRHVKLGKLFAANLPLMLFYVYFAISIAWSEDPTGSTKRLIKDFGMLLVVAVILSEKHPLDAMRAIYVRCACILFPLSAVFIKWFPNYARSFTVAGEPMYTGVTMQKNTLGEIVLVFSLFLIWDCLDSWPAKWRWSQMPWDRLLLIVMGFWLLQMCQSKTAFLCLAVGTALILRTGWLTSKTVSRIALVGAVSVPYLVFFAQQFNTVIEPVIEAMGRNMTFTGRTEIWQHITATTVNPWFGAGYWNFWGGTGAIKINNEMGVVIPNAHNGYVDMYLDGGVIGLIILFFLLLAYGGRLMKDLRHDPYRRLRFAVLVAMIIYNMSESMYARLSPIWFTTLLALVEYPNLKKALLKKSEPLPPKEEDLAPANPELTHWASV